MISEPRPSRPRPKPQRVPEFEVSDYSAYGKPSWEANRPSSSQYQHDIETGYPSSSSDEPRPPTRYDASYGYRVESDDPGNYDFRKTSSDDDNSDDLGSPWDASDSPKRQSFDIETGNRYNEDDYNHQQAYAGQNTDATKWSVAIKRPGNKRNNIPESKAWYVSADDNNINEIGNIMDWVHNILDSQQWDGFFAYNDQPPGCGRGAGDPSSKGAGHCKGIVAWNGRYLGWLVHSVPRWPEGRSVSLRRQNFSFPPIEHSQLILAQSFVWVILPFSSYDKVLGQLIEMQAYVFYKSPNSIWPYPDGQEIGQTNFGGASTPRKLSFCSTVSHVAKNGSWDNCIYHEFLGKSGLGSGERLHWKVQTFTKESDLSGLQFIYVADVRKLIFPDNRTCLNGSAHSKWAISSNPDYALVFIGDLNRATSQNKRGGGGIIIQSRVLWGFMNSLCETFYQNGISYEQ